jgi:hypothetical protein
MLAGQQGRPQDAGVVAQGCAIDAYLSLRISDRLGPG